MAATTGSGAAAALTACCIVLIGLAFAPRARSQTPPRTVDGIRRAPSVHGEFRVWTYDHANTNERSGRPFAPGTYHGLEHPQASWRVGSHTMSGNVELWRQCTVPGRSGSFDVRKTTMPLDAYHAIVRIELRPSFAAGSGVALHRLRWVERIDPTEVGLASGEVRVLLPATGSIWVRDAKRNLTRALAASEPGNELWLRPYWNDPLDAQRGFYYSRLNTADVLSVHAFDALDRPRWGLALHVFDHANADPGHLIVGSNPDAAGRPSIELGYDVVLPRDHVENNGSANTWIPAATLLLRSLPSVTPKQYAWWENVDFVRDLLLLPLGWLRVPTPLASSPRWARTAVIGTGYAVNDLQQAAGEAARIRRFFAKYDAAGLVAPEYHYAPAVHTWTDELYTAPPRPAFRDFMARVRQLPAGTGARTHVLAYLVTAFYEALQPNAPHPLAGARAHNDQGQPYSIRQFMWFVDPSDPAFVQAFDAAVRTLRAEGVGGAYFDNLFGDANRNYHQHAGADRRNHLDQVALLDRARDVLGWDGFFVGEQSRLGNRYAIGALVPCGFRAVPGGASVPFVDALVHEHRLTCGAGDLLEQWLAHGLHAIRTSANPRKRDLQNVVHDYMFGFVKGQLVVDGRTGYADPTSPGSAVPVQTFEVDPALLPPSASLLERLGYEVLHDVNQLVYPRMLWWRATTPALQHGRMLVPPYPTATVHGHPADEWFVLEKDYFFRIPGFAYSPLVTTEYETERFPVSFWSLPADPSRLTLFMGNPTYDSVALRFRFDTGDYPQVMLGSRWRVQLDADPEDGPGAVPQQYLPPATRFDFTLRLRPLSFRRVTFERV